MPTRHVNFAQALGLLRRRAGSPQQITQSNDRVERRPDLMAHVGEERTLCLTGQLGLRASTGEFKGSRCHQLLQTVTVTIKLEIDEHFFRDVLHHGNIVTDRSIGLTQRRDGGRRDVFTAVFLAVVKLSSPRLTVL